MIVVVVLVVAVRTGSILIVLVLVGCRGFVVIVRIIVGIVGIPIIIVVSTASPSETSPSPSSATSPKLARPQWTESQVARKFSEWPLLYNQETERCEAGQNLLKINFDFKLRNLDTIDNEMDTPKIEYNAIEYYCENLSDKLKCLEQLNRDRANEHLIERNEGDYFLTYLQSKVTRSIEKSLRNLIDPKLLERIVIVKFEKNGESTDLENEGLHSIFSVELFVETDKQENAEVIRQSLEAVCLKDTVNSNDPESSGQKTNVLRGQVLGDVTGDTDVSKALNCVIRPYLYLMKSEMKISEVNLCDNDLVKCRGSSNCEHIRQANRSSYRCRCNNGFKRRFTGREYNIEVNSCTDIDEVC